MRKERATMGMRDAKVRTCLELLITFCTESQCSTQKEVMRNMFNYFGIPVEENKQECLYQGINCNEEDTVTHIWMGEYSVLVLVLVLA